MGKIWIWDGIKNEAELIKKTMENLRAGWNDKFCNDAQKVLNDKDAMETVISSVLFFDEFTRGIRNTVVNIHVGNNLNKAVKKWRVDEKNSFDRCTWSDELQAISEGLSKEMENRLIAEAKAVRTKDGKFILHPLVKEISDKRIVAK